jgi:hypothetical protein
MRPKRGAAVFVLLFSALMGLEPAHSPETLRIPNIPNTY